MRVDVSPRHKNRGRPSSKSAPQYLAWLRKRECLAYGDGLCGGKIEAAHVDYAGGKGMGTKVADRFAIPLCSSHHRHQHSTGWPRFERECLKDGDGAALRAAEAYWRAWPGRNAWEGKQDG